MNNEMILMPRKLTAENGAKAELSGEFKIDVEHTCTACEWDGAQDDCEVCAGKVQYMQTVIVPWDTIKEIYKASVKFLGKENEPN